MAATLKTKHRYILGALPQNMEPLLKAAVERELRRVSAAFDDVDKDLAATSAGGGSTGATGVSKAYVDQQDAATLAAAKAYTDAHSGTGGVAKSYVDDQDAATLTAAKQYADQRDVAQTTTVTAAYQAADAAVLAAAKAYTDAHAGGGGSSIYPSAWQSRTVQQSGHTVYTRMRWLGPDVLQCVVDATFGTDTATAVPDAMLHIGGYPDHPETPSLAWQTSPVTRVMNSATFRPVELVLDTATNTFALARFKVSGSQPTAAGKVNFSADMIMRQV